MSCDVCRKPPAPHGAAPQRRTSCSRVSIASRARSAGFEEWPRTTGIASTSPTQINAAQAALDKDKVALGLLDGHAHHCVPDAEREDAKTEELMAAVGRLRRRG